MVSYWLSKYEFWSTSTQRFVVLHKTRHNKPTRILNINCQSILKNREAFEAILDSTRCDIITGTESWLTNIIKDNEIFPQGFNIYRRDRETGQRGGGVFIAINKDLISSRYQLAETQCEVV